MEPEPEADHPTEPIDLAQAVASGKEVPNAAQELDRYLANIPETMKHYLKDEFGAVFLGPVVLPKPEPKTPPPSPAPDLKIEDFPEGEEAEER